jgi:hypothetical protein
MSHTRWVSHEITQLLHLDKFTVIVIILHHTISMGLIIISLRSADGIYKYAIKFLEFENKPIFILMV